MPQSRASAVPPASVDAADSARTIALQMLEERGRGAVLVGVARVDAALERLLQAVLLPSPGSTDTFFQPDRPLGSFGARVTLAARLGLIDPHVEQALQTLRRVRNAFAHPPPPPPLLIHAMPIGSHRPTRRPDPTRSGSRWSGSCRRRWAVMVPHWIQPCGTTSC